MKENPLVSVIIACYNGSNYIDSCLNSLVNQSYCNIEILICDDASIDDSFEKMVEWKNKDERIIILRNETTLFAATTRNKCIEISHGDFIMIQDVDDISKINRIEYLLQILNDDTKVDFVSSAMEAFDKKPEAIFRTMKHTAEYPTKYNFLWNLPFHHPATMFRKECIIAVGGYRVATETRRGQDYDMFMRMYAKGFRGRNIQEALYLFRFDNANIKRRTFKARIGEFEIRRKGFKAMGLMPWALPFLFKPFVAHIVQKIRYAKK